MDETVQLIDVMPTLLALSHLEPPPGLQGQSLAALLASGSGASAQIRPESSAWTRRPAITEKAAEEGPHPSATEAYAIVDEGWKLVHRRVRPPGRPEFELFDARRDPLDQTDVGADHPDVVQRLAKVLDGWRAMALAARLKPDSETTKGLTADQLQRLRSLGYVR